MNVIAGLWRFAEAPNRSELVDSVSSMIDAQHRRSTGPFGAERVRASTDMAFGQSGAPAVFRRLMDSDAGGSAAVGLLAVDARIDNRAELLDLLGLALDDPIDDEGMILLACRRWGDRLVDHVVGDFAIAWWDAGRRAMTLVRDPTGQRPLHYHLGRGFAAFASMPQGVHALGDVPRASNAAWLAAFVATVPQRGSESAFRDIFRVEPGSIVRITRAGATAERYWRMPVGELRYRDPRDYVEAFREQLDRATLSRMRGAGEVVAAHLSAGLDSSAVASTAARLSAAAGGRVLAVTSAPRADFAGPVPQGRIADESALAAELAAWYPTMDHLVLRTAGRSPLDPLDDDSDLFGQPVGYPCNNLWWRQANEAARSAGATVMLTGEMGNLTVSAGGLGVLPDYLRAGRIAAWAREVIALERGGPRWRGLLAASFGPWLPRDLMGALRRFAAGGRSAPGDTLLTESGRIAAARLDRDTTRRSEREGRWDMLASSDPGNFRKGAMLAWGIDERDPTADRRLVEFCFSLPPEQLLGGGTTRRLARTALADRVPAAILNGPRGYQYADWYEAVHGPDLQRAARRIAASPAAAAVIDVGAVERMIAAWPPGDWASASTIGGYRVGLLRALSVGIFALKAER